MVKECNGFLEELQKLLDKREELSIDLLRIESRMFKLEQNELLKHLELGTTKTGNTKHRRPVRKTMKPSQKLMVFSNTSKTTKFACELAERVEKFRSKKHKMRESVSSTSCGSSGDTDPETVGIAGLEAAASRDAELRAAHRKQFEATRRMKKRHQS
ncbi:unnamed protein product [Cylicocyclus nassatus]|uniref:Uncharacterized protein n=1 Tax=Cylicocyclus nassatus TaxID=53992 RepID=A0AA36GRB6_CYLNA|nr:unnamed protein product [Cylicocyclus nassatus]